MIKKENSTIEYRIYNTLRHNFVFYPARDRIDRSVADRVQINEKIIP